MSEEIRKPPDSGCGIERTVTANHQRCFNCELELGETGKSGLSQKTAPKFTGYHLPVGYVKGKGSFTARIHASVQRSDQYSLSSERQFFVQWLRSACSKLSRQFRSRSRFHARFADQSFRSPGSARRSTRNQMGVADRIVSELGWSYGGISLTISSPLTIDSKERLAARASVYI